MVTFPATVPISARHNVYYGEEFNFTEEDDAPLDMTGYAARAQVRLYGAQPGSPKIDIPSVTGDVEGVWVITPASGAVQLKIGKSTLLNAYEALSGSIEPGADILLSWDLLVTPLGLEEEIWAEGIFTLKAGVTV